MLIGISEFSYVIYAITALCILCAVTLFSKNGKIAETTLVSRFITIALALLISIMIGFRSTDDGVNGDTWLYAHLYNNIYDAQIFSDTEWIWDLMMVTCKSIGMDVTFFFTIIAFLYVGLMLYACFLLLKNHVFYAFLFCISSFSFFAYGINGIRNGLATSIMLISIIYIIRSKKLVFFIGILLGLIAMGIHKSCALPLICVIISKFTIKSYGITLAIWGACIIIALILGTKVSTLFMDLGFDSRLDRYLDGEARLGLFSKVGFRYDFLLYSAVPIFFSWFILIKHRIVDNTYLMLSSTYTLTNSFWVLINEVPYSNRFAYLSWFLIPFVISYPLLKFDIWEDQSQTLGLVLLLYSLVPLFF